MSNYNKITALYSRLSVGDEDRDGGESNSIQNQKIFLENYAKGQHLTNIRHYIDDDESGRFFDRSAYSRMIEDVESGKIGVCIMKDLTRWGRDYLQVGNAMEIFRRNNVRFIAVNNGIDSENPDTLELLFCKDCGAKMHIRIDYRNGGKRHVAYCSEYHKGKAKNPKCSSPHIMDADLLMQTVADVLKKIAEYSISNRAEFEALVKKSLAMQQTDKTKKQQKRIPQITTRLEQIDKVLNKLYEDNALGTIPQDRYEQMSQKYSEEYYALKAELATLQEQLSAYENAGGRAQKFLKLTERHAAFTELTPAILNEFISRIEVHERDQKRARYAIQHISIYFNYIGKFENEVTQLAEPTEQEIRQMREEIEEAKKEKSRAYHRQYSREYRARNLEKQREYDRMKAREYRARRKAQAAAAQPTQ